MTTTLSLANGALRLLKSNRPLTQSEYTNGTREQARAVKAAIDGGALTYCLEAGQWKFAMRTAMVDASPSVEPDFGYAYAFDKPTDFVRTSSVYSDEYMQCPLSDYRDEAGFWFSSFETIYVRYVSDDAQYGMDMSLWPQSFVKFVEAHLASEIAGPLTGEGKDMLRLRKTLLGEALGLDAMADPTRMLPAGNWAKARRGGWGRYGERR